MKRLKVLTFWLLLCTTTGIASPQHYLSGKINETDRRYKSFLRALELCEERHFQVLVETGTARDGDENFKGDGGSSLIFGKWAFDRGAKLYSVDIDINALDRARTVAHFFERAIQFVHSNSIEFLKCFEGPIDFLYLVLFPKNPLQSFRVKVPAIELLQSSLYSSIQQRFAAVQARVFHAGNTVRDFWERALDSYDFRTQLCRLSQMHHLAEIQAAYPRLHEGSIVMIDDCDLPHGGKGKLVIEFLEKQGWKVLHKEYQVIMGFEK